MRRNGDIIMEKQLRIGVFGTWRGNAYIKASKFVDGAIITAICDKNPERIESAKKNCPEDVAIFDNFDEFINSGLFEAVFLCNYFHEHAEYAIRAMEKGIHVFSETMAASTMAQCVALCRAVEKTGCVYMLAENYPFTRGCLEMKRLYETGKLGKAMFEEGEYVHPMSPKESWKYNDPAIHGDFHWRRYLPVTYYCSHALAPIMHITNAVPKSVVAMAAPDTDEHIAEYKHSRTDCVGVMLLSMSDGAVCRINGSSYIAPHGNWYRVGCLNGGAETIRGDEKKIRVAYNSWCVPEGDHRECVYEAQWQADADKANANGHGGGDYWVVKHFVDAILEGKQPFFDVYRSTAIAAVSILGWRSVLNKSKRYDIPDFRRERDKKKWENDDLTPFPKAGAPNTLPFNSRDKI